MLQNTKFNTLGLRVGLFRNQDLDFRVYGLVACESTESIREGTMSNLKTSFEGHDHKTLNPKSPNPGTAEQQ